MNFLLYLFERTIIMLFPIVIWKSVEKIINDSYYALILSFIISLFIINDDLLLFFNIYLGIAISKNSKLLYFIFSIITMIFKSKYFFFLTIEYSVIFLLFYVKKYRFNLFIFISIYFYSLISFLRLISLFKIITVIIVFYLVELYIRNIILKDIYDDIQRKYNGYLFNFIHEVKNPLSVVLGYLEMIKEKDDYDINKYLMVIDKEVNESMTIIEDYLMYGRFNVVFDYMDINVLLKEVYSDFKKLEKIYDLDLNFYYDEEEVIVFGDYSKLKQVFINIIKNSIEAHDSNKLVIDMDYKIIKDNVIIDISDNGKGLINNNLVGKEYYTSKMTGNGIGTYYSKKILGLHNGDIKFIPNDKKGCNVRISLPVVNI